MSVLPSENVSKTLAEFVASARMEQLDECALAYSRYALLDQLGVSLAASRLGEGCLAFTDLASQQGGRGESTLLMTGKKVPAAQAAFANGALSHALDFEDAHDGALVHPNAASVPAALAVAEALCAAGRLVSGKQLLMAIAIGCEVVCRMGLALRVALDDYGWYPPPILGTFGATAAAARLYGLNRDQVLSAFSLTLSQATCSAELKYNPDSDIRAVRDAFPAHAGVISAQLAASGIKGFAQPLEGKAGFFATFARGEYKPSVLVERLGDSFEIAKLSFKAWPSCRGTHPFIEAALTLSREHGFTPEDVERIDVFGHRINRMLAEPMPSKRAPKTAIDAKFSIPFCVATALVEGDVGLGHFSESARSNSRVLTLAKLVHFHADEELRQQSDLTRGRTHIHLRDGTRMEANVTHPYGCPERPLCEADLVKKFSQCAQMALKPVSDVRGLAESILSLESAEDLQARLFDYYPAEADS